MKKLLFLSLLITKTIFSYSLFLINDSPFELTAIIQGATGILLGQEILQPGEQRRWSTEMVKTDVEEIYDADASLTPFTIIWKCAYKGQYSMCTNVSPGATVSAHSCPGSRECTPKPKKEKDSCPCPKESN